MAGPCRSGRLALNRCVQGSPVTFWQRRLRQVARFRRKEGGGLPPRTPWANIPKDSHERTGFSKEKTTRTTSKTKHGGYLLRFRGIGSSADVVRTKKNRSVHIKQSPAAG